MNLTVRYNISPDQWDNFAIKFARDGGFLQSWQWGQFQERLGRKIFRISIFDGADLVAIALLVRQEMMLGFRYLYSPRGPVIISDQKANKDIFNLLNSTAAKIAKQEQVVFYRLDPAWTEGDLLTAAGFQSNGVVQPKSTLILDLSISETEILSQMKPKTRYNIKLAQKRGIKIIESDGNSADFAEFWRLLEQTSLRDGITSHSQEYYRQMLLCPAVKLVLAKDNDVPIAANIMVGFGKFTTYLHGASDYGSRQHMAPYLLQWQMILNAQKNGCLAYDFWGADEVKWPGVTRFKRGFAPNTQLTTYIGAYDLPYNKILYGAYMAIKKFRH